MNKRINYSYTGGFPVTQFTFQFMQESYRAAFAGLAALIGDKVIISGVSVVGGAVSDGWISVAGELLPFVGGPLADGDHVIVVETTASRVFDDGAPHDVYFTKEARISGSGGFLFTELKSLGTLSTFFTAFQDLLEAFNEHTHSWNDIEDRPAADIKHIGVHFFGDVGTTDATITVTHGLDLDGYSVFGTLVGNNNNFATNNDVFFIIYDKQANSFKIGLREVTGDTQNLRFEYIIVKAN